jgi:dihydrofolate synthase/folylpolyglutamate synthase
MRNYQQTLEYLFAQLPVFQRDGASAYKPTIANTIALCNALGNPEKKFKSIHVAGTNGKGSTSHQLAAIFQAAGYKTGLYTSPHLKDFRERIKVNGQEIPEKNVIAFTEKHQVLFEKIKPSFFEMTVAMAFDYFANENVEIAIIEVGMGGRLDSTNIIQPELCLITNISFDHQAYLGNTIEEIAKEKAGIIKKGVPVVIASTQPAIQSVFENIASEQQSPIYFADQQYHLKRNKNSTQHLLSLSYADKNGIERNIYSDLTGNYQLKNITGVLCAIEILKSKFDLLNDEHTIAALAKVKSTTGLKGRWELLSENPQCIADTGHNEDGIQQILTQLKLCTYQNLHWVIGMVNDKDINAVLSLLPKNATYYFCKPNIPRGLSAATLQHSAHEFNLKGDCYESVTLALSAAKKNATPNDLILIAGSTFIVAEII